MFDDNDFPETRLRDGFRPHVTIMNMREAEYQGEYYIKVRTSTLNKEIIIHAI